MKAAITAVLLYLCLAVSVAAQQTSVTGVTLNVVTQQPLAGVHVTLYPATSESPMIATTYGAVSKQDGHFSVDGVKPGPYNLLAARNGYVLSEEQTVTLKRGEPVVSLTVPMAAAAVISGTVTDEFGDPVKQARIQTEPPRGYAQTDERGWFRISLPPGKYVVKATVTNLRNLIMRETAEDGANDPVYAPSSSDPFELKPGQMVDTVNFRLTPSHSLTISGRVADVHAEAGMVVIRGGRDRLIDMVSSLGASGDFGFTGLPPGDYSIAARTGDMQSALYEARLDSADITGINLVVVPPETLTGTVEGIKGAAEKMYVRLSPNVHGRLSPMNEPVSGEVGTDGSFRVEKVYPRTYQVSVAPLPENAYVKSVMLDSVEAPDRTVDLTHGVAGSHLKVTVSPNGGRIDGTVLTEEAAWVSLDADHSQLTDSDGRFHFSGLRPGKYHVIAYRGERPSADDAPEIEVHEGDRIELKVKLSEPKH